MQTIVRLLIILACSALCSTGWTAEETPSAKKAAELFDAGNCEDALPLVRFRAQAPDGNGRRRDEASRD